MDKLYYKCYNWCYKFTGEDNRHTTKVFCHLVGDCTGEIKNVRMSNIKWEKKSFASSVLKELLKSANMEREHDFLVEVLTL